MWKVSKFVLNIYISIYFSLPSKLRLKNQFFDIWKPLLNLWIHRFMPKFMDKNWKKKKEKKNEHKNIISGTKKRWNNKIVNFIVNKILNMVLEKRPMNDNFLFLLIKKKKKQTFNRVRDISRLTKFKKIIIYVQQEGITLFRLFSRNIFPRFATHKIYRSIVRYKNI